MNLLPDMIIIDFCEWLKKTILPERKDLDFFDLILDEHYDPDLRRYASYFLQQYKPTCKNIFHQYIESEYFDRSVSKCDRTYKKSFNKWYKQPLCDNEFIHFCFHEGRFDKSLCEFIQETYGDLECFFDSNLSNNVRSHELAESSRYLFSNARGDSWIQNNKQWVLQFMNRLDIDLEIESDFLEWLIRTNGQPIDIRKMPLKTFERLAERFGADCKRSKRDTEKIIRSFKQKDFIVLSEKLLAVLPINMAKRAKDLGYIVERYQNMNVQFKCFIMPLHSDTKEYQELIEKRWEDLHYLSGNYLDIYYAATDYGKSGYEIMSRMNYIPDTLKTKAPIIIIWDTDLSKAQGIDISRLDNTDIFEVIRGIVNSIQNKYELAKIVREANQMSRELREQHRAVSYSTTNNTINNNGTITGNVAAVNYGTMSANMVENFDNFKLLEELEKAKQIISNFDDINELQRQRLSVILDEANEAVKSGSDDGQQESKKSFKDAICFMGNVGGKLIAALSGLANLLKFFGISPV